MRLPGRRLPWLQDALFVATVALPAYAAATRTMARLGVGLAWSHHACLVGLALLLAVGLSATVGLLPIGRGRRADRGPWKC